MIRPRKIMNSKEWEKNVHLLQKCFQKIPSILEIKNNSKKTNNLLKYLIEYKIPQFNKIWIRKTGNYYKNKSLMKECRKQEKIKWEKMQCLKEAFL